MLSHKMTSWTGFVTWFRGCQRVQQVFGGLNYFWGLLYNQVFLGEVYMLYCSRDRVVHDGFYPDALNELVIFQVQYF